MPDPREGVAARYDTAKLTDRELEDELARRPGKSAGYTAALRAERERRSAATIRSQAVENVDARYGFTVEFSNTPDQHRAEYDEEEARLTAEAVAARPQERTLILEIAVPDFNCEDYRLDGPDRFMNEALAEAAAHNTDGATPEWFGWQALEDSGLTTSRINLSILLGGKDGNFLERVKGQLVGQRIVERTPEHELSGDERLDDHEERERGR